MQLSPHVLIVGRELDIENRASARRVGKVYLAAEARDDLLDDAQPEAGAALTPGVGGVGLREFARICVA